MCRVPSPFNSPPPRLHLKVQTGIRPFRPAKVQPPPEQQKGGEGRRGGLSNFARALRTSPLPSSCAAATPSHSPRFPAAFPRGPLPRLLSGARLVSRLRLAELCCLLSFFPHSPPQQQVKGGRCPGTLAGRPEKGLAWGGAGGGGTPQMPRPSLARRARLNRGQGRGRRRRRGGGGSERARARASHPLRKVCCSSQKFSLSPNCPGRSSQEEFTGFVGVWGDKGEPLPYSFVYSLIGVL